MWTLNPVLNIKMEEPLHTCKQCLTGLESIKNPSQMPANNRLSVIY